MDLWSQERDGLRGILESYDSELGSDYTPLLGRRLREAEEGQARSQGLLAQLEVHTKHTLNTPYTHYTQRHTLTLFSSAGPAECCSGGDGGCETTAAVCEYTHYTHTIHTHTHTHTIHTHTLHTHTPYTHTPYTHAPHLRTTHT